MLFLLLSSSLIETFERLGPWGIKEKRRREQGRGFSFSKQLNGSQITNGSSNRCDLGDVEAGFLGIRIWHAEGKFNNLKMKFIYDVYLQVQVAHECRIMHLPFQYMLAESSYHGERDLDFCLQLFLEVCDVWNFQYVLCHWKVVYPNAGVLKPMFDSPPHLQLTQKQWSIKFQ